MKDTDQLAELLSPELPKFNIEGLVDEEETLDEILSNRSRVGWKPDLGRLDAAVVDGQLLVPVGGKILIEYTDTPWRDTTIFVVIAIDPGEQTPKGYVRLWDPNKFQYAATNYLTGQDQGLTFKIPDKSRRWVPGEDESLLDQVSRRKTRATEAVEKPVDSDGNPIVKKRGRPKGSKNKTTLIKEQNQ